MEISINYKMERKIHFVSKRKNFFNKKNTVIYQIEKKRIWNGDHELNGILDFFQMVENKSYKYQVFSIYAIKI